MLLSQSIPNLIGGVSQQPPALRSPTQGEVCDNVILSITDGLRKRPPTNTVADLWTTASPLTDPLVHFIDRDGVERYVVIFGDTNPRVYSLNNGASYPVVWANATADRTYFNSFGTLTARKAGRAITLADTTYFLNTTAITQQTSTTFGSGITPTYATVLWIKQATNSATYAVNLNNSLAATYTAPATGTVSTAVVCSGIATALATAGFTSGNGWTIQTNGSYLVIYKNDSSSFTFECLDSLGGTAISFIQNGKAVIQFSDLPSYAMDGIVITVQGSLSAGSTGTDPYYVQFSAQTLGGGGTNLFPAPGVWKECPKPGVKTQIDASTMPRQMARKVDTDGSITGTIGQIYFYISEVAWNSRTCGDDTTNTAPSFVGTTIGDIFFYQNRLGFLAGVNVVLSESGNYTNFWRTTTLNLQDNDFIDIQATDDRVVSLRFAVPWQQQLVMFGDLKQYLLTPGSNTAALTPSNVTVVPLTAYDSAIYVRPQAVQNLLYFPFDLNGFVGLREYYVEYYTQKHVGKPVTDSVPKYLPGNPTRLSACNSADFLAMTCDGDPASIYVYKWQWAGNTLYSADKVQSSWYRWNFDVSTLTSTTVVGFTFYAQQMYLVMARNRAGITTYSLESMTVDAAPQDSGVYPFYVSHLDRRVSQAQCTASFNAALNQTTITTPTQFDGDVRVVSATGSDGGGVDGISYPVISNSSKQVIVTGQLTVSGATYWVGQNYTMRFRFSPLMFREPAAQGGPPIGVLNSKTQLRTLTIRAANTGYFRLEITPRYRQTYLVPFTGNVAGVGLALLGTTPAQEENVEVRSLVGVNCDQVQIDLVNDTPLPCRISNAEYEVLFYARAKRS